MFTVNSPFFADPVLGTSTALPSLNTFNVSPSPYSSHSVSELLRTFAGLPIWLFFVGFLVIERFDEEI